MKEKLSEVSGCKYDKELYPQCVLGMKVMQPSFNYEDFIIYDNPESKYFRPEPEPEVEEVKPVDPRQGEFVFPPRRVKVVK